jgi:hypothetical protein
MALEDGDSISLSGALTPKVWVHRDGKAHPTIDMVASVALTAYHGRRKKQVVASTAEEEA